MKKIATLILLFFVSISTYAQFLTDSLSTYKICNAALTQHNVRAFSDGQNGYHLFWIDKRNGTAGTTITMQHLDSSGVALGTINGDVVASTIGREIWGYDVSPWQSGYLLTWVQGAPGVGGDSVFCDYISGSGVHYWTEPTLVSYRTGVVIYLNEYGMRAMPNDSGATLSYGLTYSGGSDAFSFNRIDFNGVLQWPVNSSTIATAGYINQVTSDQHNGFYIASSSGGISAPIWVSHYKLDGSSYSASALNISQTAGGRNSGWTLLCDADTNAYVIWDTNLGDIVMAKVNSNVQFTWPTQFTSVCAFPGSQAYSNAILDNNTIYVTWSDARVPAANAFIYTQQFDLDGNAQWTQDGILVSDLNSYIPYPKVVVRNDGSVANAFTVAGKFRMQSIHADSTFDWQQNGIALSGTVPFYNDFTLITDASESVAAFWSDDLDIYGSRISRRGLLTKLNDIKQHDFSIYPNPNSGTMNIRLNEKMDNLNLTISNIQGQEIFTENYNHISATEVLKLNLKNISSGVYFIRISTRNSQQIRKVIIQ